MEKRRGRSKMRGGGEGDGSGIERGMGTDSGRWTKGTGKKGDCARDGRK